MGPLNGDMDLPDFAWPLTSCSPGFGKISTIAVSRKGQRLKFLFARRC